VVALKKAPVPAASARESADPYSLTGGIPDQPGRYSGNRYSQPLSSHVETRHAASGLADPMMSLFDNQSDLESSSKSERMRTTKPKNAEAAIL
jgi:hypothetical protein